MWGRSQGPAAPPTSPPVTPLLCSCLLRLLFPSTTRAPPSSGRQKTGRGGWTQEETEWRGNSVRLRATLPASLLPAQGPKMPTDSPRIFQLIFPASLSLQPEKVKREVSTLGLLPCWPNPKFSSAVLCEKEMKSLLELGRPPAPGSQHTRSGHSRDCPRKHG